MLKESKKYDIKRGAVCIFLALAVFLSALASETSEVRASQLYSWGSYGETVKIIQTKLSRWGYYAGPIDGIFGYKTYEAVIYFQKTNGLKQDGICGKYTLEAMGIFQTAAPAAKPGTTSAPSVEPNDGQSAREADIWLLAKIINGEGRGESYLGQVAIGAVVMNRVRHSSFPNTVPGGIYQAGAFDAVKDGQINLTPSESCVLAARDAYNGWDPVDGALFYWNPVTATSKWILTLTVTKTIGNHVFAVN